MHKPMKILLFGATLAVAPAAHAFGWEDIEDGAEDAREEANEEAAKRRGEQPIVND